jgi:hypothetical protein
MTHPQIADFTSPDLAVFARPKTGAPLSKWMARRGVCFGTYPRPTQVPGKTPLPGTSNDGWATQQGQPGMLARNEEVEAPLSDAEGAAVDEINPLPPMEFQYNPDGSAPNIRQSIHILLPSC